MRDYIKSSIYIIGISAYLMFAILLAPIIFIFSLSIIVSSTLYFLYAVIAYYFNIKTYLLKFAIILFVIGLVNFIIIFFSDISLFISLILIFHHFLFTIASLVIWRIEVYFPGYLDEEIETPNLLIKIINKIKGIN